MSQTANSMDGPQSVILARPVPVESRDELDSVRQRIASGQAFLRVVEYPWGVEFELCDVEGQQ